MDDRSLKRKVKRELGVAPGKPELYQEAFRHRSALDDKDELRSNERLEFLGDAMLDAVISELLYEHYPEASEGFLTQMRSKLVSRERLNRTAESLGMNEFLQHRVSKSEEPSAIGGDALEALVGAIYLDKGYKKTRKWILRTLVGPLDLERLQDLETDPKSRLIEWAQKNGHSAEFKTIQENGDADHHRIVLYIDGEEVSRGEGRTKKKGEQEAAHRFFQEQEEDARS